MTIGESWFVACVLALVLGMGAVEVAARATSVLIGG